MGHGRAGSLRDAAVVEGNSGTTNATFTLSLSEPTTNTVTVRVATANGTATAGSDYTAVSAVLVTFAPGFTTQTVNVSVLGDGVVEFSETFLSLDRTRLRGRRTRHR